MNSAIFAQRFINSIRLGAFPLIPLCYFQNFFIQQHLDRVVDAAAFTRMSPS